MNSNLRADAIDCLDGGQPVKEIGKLIKLFQPRWDFSKFCWLKCTLSNLSSLTHWSSARLLTYGINLLSFRAAYNRKSCFSRASLFHFGGLWDLIDRWSRLKALALSYVNLFGYCLCWNTYLKVAYTAKKLADIADALGWSDRVSTHLHTHSIFHAQRNVGRRRP